MVLKTFNVDKDVYAKFSSFCKDNGLSMSKQVTIFMKSQMEDEPEIREEYIQKLNRLRKGRFVKVDDFEQRYQL